MDAVEINEIVIFNRNTFGNFFVIKLSESLQYDLSLSKELCNRGGRGNNLTLDRGYGKNVIGKCL